MKPLSRMLIFGLLLTAVGCASQPHQGVPVEAPPVSARTLPIPVAAMDDRIQSLENRLKKDGLSSKAKKLAYTLIDTYREIKRVSQEPYLTPKTYDRVIQTLFQSLTTTEQQFFECAISPGESSAGVERFLKMREEIFNAFLNGNHPLVINRTRILADTFGPDAVTPDIAMVYALSLAETGETKTALVVGDSVTPKLDQLPDPVRLRAGLAQTALRGGMADRAAHHYEVLLDLQSERAALVDAVGRALAHETPLPEHLKTRDQSASDLPSQPPVRPTFTTLDDLLEAVDARIEKNAYQDAKLLLIRHRLTFEGGPALEAIDRKLQAVEDLQKTYEEERLIREAYVKETLQGAKHLMEAEQFEDAVDRLDRMEGDAAFKAETSALRAQAVLNIINRERNRAARLFLEAKKTSDTQKKEKLLTQSYNVLKALNEKYPSSSLNEKVLSHMEIVKNELEKVQ